MKKVPAPAEQKPVVQGNTAGDAAEMAAFRKSGKSKKGYTRKAKPMAKPC